MALGVVTTNPHIVIVGGGITGLAAALQVERTAEQAGVEVAITLLERSEHVGGKLLSERIDGFVVDGGADIFLANKPAAMSLCETLGITNELIETNPDTRKTFIQRNHVLHPETMYANERLVTPRTGMQRLIEATAAALVRTDVKTGCAVTNISRSATGYLVKTSNGNELAANGVIVTLPAHATASTLETLSPQLSSDLAALPYSTTTTISAGFLATDVSYLLDGYGYLVENPEPGFITACTWSSSKIDGRAPQDGVLLRGYVRAGHELPPEIAQQHFLDELRDTLGVTAAPLFIRSYVWEKSLPIYPANNTDRIVALRKTLADFPGLELAGSALHAPGIPDSVQSAFDAVHHLWSHLRSHTSS